MSNTARAVFGGLAVGLGDGMIRQDEQRREQAERLRQEALEESRYQRRRGDQVADREATADANKGLLQSTVVGEDGNLHGITRGGDVMDLGVRPADKKDGDAGPGGIKAADRTMIEKISNKYHGSLNADGQFFLPDDARDKYALAVERGEELRMLGVPTQKAARIANQSVVGPMADEDARRIAEAEAKEQFSGFGKGRQREDYISKRVPQLIEESQSAQREYEQLIGGASSVTDGAAMGGQQDGKPTTGEHANAPSINSKAEYEKLASGTVFWNARTKQLERKP